MQSRGARSNDGVTSALEQKPQAFIFKQTMLCLPCLLLRTHRRAQQLLTPPAVKLGQSLAMPWRWARMEMPAGMGQPKMEMGTMGMGSAGMERIVPAIKLRGLPYDAAEDDIRVFIVSLVLLPLYSPVV